MKINKHCLLAVAALGAIYPYPTGALVKNNRKAEDGSTSTTADHATSKIVISPVNDSEAPEKHATKKVHKSKVGKYVTKERQNSNRGNAVEEKALSTFRSMESDSFDYLCGEKDKDKFWYGKNKKQGKERNCKWLTKLQESKKNKWEKVCNQRFKGPGGLRPARQVCPSVCELNCLKSWQKIGADIEVEAAVGRSVSLSSNGKVVAIGVDDTNDGNGNYSGGHVSIYQWSDSTWTQMGADIDGETNPIKSHVSVSLSSNGKILAIGKIYFGDVISNVRIYQWSESTSRWTQMGEDIDGETFSDDFGSSVSLSSNGEVVAIGAPFKYGNGTARSGHVRIYQWSGSYFGWSQMGVDIDGETDYDKSGSSVSLSSNGEVVAIGAPANDGINDYCNSGHVRIYRWSGSPREWSQMGADIDGEYYYDLSGSSVSLSSNGKTVAIGAPANDGNGRYYGGHVRIYRWSGSPPKWSQMGADIDGENYYDRSGSSVSLSSNGKTVAIGAPRNSGRGENHGHVRIYRWSGSPPKWSQMGADIDGEVDYEAAGNSVSLSSNGKMVAIAAPIDDGIGDRTGRVRIYQWAR